MKGFLNILFFVVLMNLFFYSSNSYGRDVETFVLFLGNSNVRYNNLPKLFEDLSINSNKNVFVDSYAMDGMQLADHLTDPDALNKISERQWDYVVLIGGSMRAAYPDSFIQKPVKQALADLKNLITENNDSAKTIYCMPWAYEDGMKWLVGWTDDYKEMQQKIYSNTLRLKSDIDFWIAPVGWAWFMVLKENDYPLHFLHREDWSHPTLDGSYLAACVIFATLFQESCSGNLFYSDLSSELAQSYQETASKIVLDDLVLWNIEKEEIVPEPDRYFEIAQNYPNPFSTNSTISFEVFKPALIHLRVNNELGKQILDPVNSYLKTGKYHVNIDSNVLQKGIYHYEISVKNERVVKSMVVF